MKSNRFARVLLVSVLLLVALPATTGAVPASGSPERIDRYILNQLATTPRVNLFVKMASDAALDRAEALGSKAAKGQFVYDTLTAHAASSQKAIKSFLDGSGARYYTFWINNSLYVYGADLALVQTLAGRSDVAYLRGNRSVPLHKPVSVKMSKAATPQVIEWGVDLVNAPDVWAMGNRGAGQVVANNDTGVRYTHDAVDDQYRGAAGDHNYNWWDPDEFNPGQSETLFPNDTNGHGTHTMGTMVGDDGGTNQIGVAPEANWIAGKGCASFFCTEFDLIDVAQFMACPTDLNGQNPDCSKAPGVVNNSWGGTGGDPWYTSYTDAWLAADIVPVFSAGNSGPSCNTLGSPGDYKRVLGVGAIDINSVLASFSSKGPSTLTTRAKPDVVAPGANVRSSYSTSDTAYALLSGTSMAAPHTSGTIALMRADSPSASITTLVRVIRNTAAQGLPNPPDPDTCGGIPYNVYPNHIYGKGRVDALAAVNVLP